MNYLEDKTFNSTTDFKVGEYDNCTFKNCDFQSVDLKNYVFSDCFFEECNLSNQKLYNTAFKTVEFIKCKLVGIDFTNCNPFLFKVYFNACNLDFSSFYQLKLKETPFINCSLKSVDFSECELSKSIFNYAVLNNTIFEGTKLMKADFRNATNFAINPSLNNIEGAKFSRESIDGLLVHHKIKIE